MLALVCRKCGNTHREKEFKIQYHKGTSNDCFGQCRAAPGPSEGEHLSITCPVCAFLWKQLCVDTSERRSRNEE